MADSETRGVRLPRTLWAEVDRVAGAAHRSRNWVIVHALERVLEGRCRNPPDPGECDTVHSVGSSARDGTGEKP